MNLAEYIENNIGLWTNITNGSISPDYNYFNTDSQTVSGQLLSNIKYDLYKLNDFRHVKEINILCMPSYMCFVDGTPFREVLVTSKFDEIKRNVLIEKSDRVEQTTVTSVRTYKYVEGSNFNEIIDLYAISLTPVLIDPHSLKSIKGIMFRMSPRSAGINSKYYNKNDRRFEINC